MSSHFIDFRWLKHAVLIEDILECKGLLGNFRRSGSRLVGPCPLHQGDNMSAFVVMREINRWRCFSRCDDSGDVIDFLARLEQLSLAEAAQRLIALGILLPPRISPRLDTTRAPFVPFGRTLPLTHRCAFLNRKGISEATARTFHVGRYEGEGFLKGCLAVRLFDPLGRPFGYAGRQLDPGRVETFGKWKLPRRFPASRVLYNFHRLRGTPFETCILVECPWSVMRLHQVGLPAVALFGVHLSGHQRALLRRFTRLVLLLDGDNAGREATARLLRSLSPEFAVNCFELPDGSDPDDFSDHELEAVKELL